MLSATGKKKENKIKAKVICVSWDTSGGTFYNYVVEGDQYQDRVNYYPVLIGIRKKGKKAKWRRDPSTPMGIIISCGGHTVSLVEGGKDVAFLGQVQDGGRGRSQGSTIGCMNERAAIAVEWAEITGWISRMDYSLRREEG